jgi:hypothetical protein
LALHSLVIATATATNATLLHVSVGHQISK